jgi:hypothetical protein
LTATHFRSRQGPEAQPRHTDIAPVAGVFEYVVGQLPAFGNVIRLGLRYARITGDGTLRVCLRLVVVGTAGALIYLVNKVILAAAGRFDFAYPLGAKTVRTITPAICTLALRLGDVRLRQARRRTARSIVRLAGGWVAGPVQHP